MNEPRLELRAIDGRAAIAEAQRQAAVARGDREAVRAAEIELSRLWSRRCDLERHNEESQHGR